MIYRPTVPPNEKLLNVVVCGKISDPINYIYVSDDNVSCHTPMPPN
jgi:hypothetical protein